MLDDLDRLRNNSALLQLLTHYAALAEADRQAWQDRVMAMEGVEAPELVQLHGELIAFSWIDQNTGNTPIVRVGAVPACYRATPAGVRAVQQMQCPNLDDEEPLMPRAVETPTPRVSRRRRDYATSA